MKDINTIRQQVEVYLDGIYVDGGVSIVDEAIIENQEFFVFFYQPKDYLRTLNQSYLLAGNAPVIH